ncbi:hypothetical protein [Aliidiomarina celeris]|uniref:hypothetical protein n=1 Tax=Aliidiomarina celeris TaxID=2249428 RepID=UPI000DE85C7C|nr:hypothetical protein [Aliidiomarina celeris]
MSDRYYPFKSKRGPSGKREREEAPLLYFQKALTHLKNNPQDMAILKQNLAFYEQQVHLPKQAKLGMQRYRHFLAVSNNPDELEKWVLQDSYEGMRFRQFPLIFKGLVE